MYDRSNRFPKLYTATSAQVGPGTYNINDSIEEDGYNYAPFLSLQPRSLSHDNKATLNQPSSNCYNLVFKEHVKGIHSMQNRAPRFVYKEADGPGPLEYYSEINDESHESKSTSPRISCCGKMVRGKLQNRHRISIPSVPFTRCPYRNKNSFCGYELTPEGNLVRRIPTVIPEMDGSHIAHDSMKLPRYKGVYFGNWTETRDSPLFNKNDRPGPADYDIIRSTPQIKRIPYTGQRWSTIINETDEKGYIALGTKLNKLPVTSKLISNMKKVETGFCNEDFPRSLRYLDLIVRNTTRENIPPPNAYNIVEARCNITLKCGDIKRKFLSSAPRFRYIENDVPAPGTYEPNPTKFDFFYEKDMEAAPFLQRSPRFPKPKVSQSPDPASYKIPGMTDEMLIRLRPRPPPRDRHCLPAFGSKGFRVIDMTIPGAKGIPGPNSYDISEKSRKTYRRTMDAVFSSTTERCVTPPNVITRGPYCRMQLFNKEVRDILNGDFITMKKHIRVTPDSLRMILRRLPTKKQGWSKEFEVAVFLFWLACGASFRVVGAVFSIPRSTANMMVKGMLDDIIGLIPLVLTFPMERLEEVGIGFSNLCGSLVFRRAVGALDGTHIRILAGSNVHNEYINRKLFYSLQLQGLCDDEGKFIDIFCGFPGSVHDARVLRHSGLYRNGIYPPLGYFILGDSGYPCIENPISIVTPYRNANGLAQISFNRTLSKARIIIERAFGMMKTRWRSIFTKALEVKIKTGVKTIASCAVLHNICLSAGDILNVHDQDLLNHHQRINNFLLPANNEPDYHRLREVLLEFHTLEQGIL